MRDWTSGLCVIRNISNKYIIYVTIDILNGSELENFISDPESLVITYVNGPLVLFILLQYLKCVVPSAISVDYGYSQCSGLFIGYSVTKLYIQIRK